MVDLSRIIPAYEDYYFFYERNLGLQSCDKTMLLLVKTKYNCFLKTFTGK